MWEFLDRLIAVAIPRIRRLPWAAGHVVGTDGRNYTFGLNDQTVFPEIEYDKIDTRGGMDITIVTTATNDAAGKALLDAFGFPFRTVPTPSPSCRRRSGPAVRSVAASPPRRSRGVATTMAKKALVNKAAGKPKFKVRAYTGAAVAVEPARCSASSDSAVCASRARPRRRDPRSDEVELVRGEEPRC